MNRTTTKNRLEVFDLPDSPRVRDLRRRVRLAMETPPDRWPIPARIDERFMSEPLAVRKARAIALKLQHMPTDLWDGQLIAGSMTLEEPRLHAEWDFPDYVTPEERAEAAKKGLGIRSVFGHVVPNYPRLIAKGLRGIRADASAQRPLAQTPDETAMLDSVVISLDAVADFAERLASRCAQEARKLTTGRTRRRAEVQARAAELLQMAADLREAPVGPCRTFRQALQSVWLVHMVFHSTMDGNAVGRLDQFAWPLLQADLDARRITLEAAAELLDCFCLKFNERAKTTEDQRPDARKEEPLDLHHRTRHYTSSQVGRDRDRLVLEAVTRPDLVDPDASVHRYSTISDERRIHRPFEAGDFDLDPAEQIDRGDVLGAAVRRGVAPAASLAVKGEQLVAGLRQREGRGLVVGHGNLRWGRR